MAEPAGSPEIAVIVGAGPGLGLAVARRFAREGAAVALVARNAQRLAGMVEELRDTAGSGSSAAAFVADAGDPAQLRAALGSVRSALGEPTVLVHHLSVPVAGTPTTMSYEEFHAGLAGGVGALLVAAQELVPAMRGAGRGTVLVTGGGLALSPSAAYAGLAAQKAAVRSLALSLAQEVAPDGVHVATVTVQGIIQPGGHYDPDRIAEVYWALHTEPRDEWRTEVRYRDPA
ncbi:MAG TPA: SDR family NAD(P)-dependent oxidoreductase [Mycobacteriales bacterium]|nr:SDR family NAD(P)-dependent oxidoreductase [Mycobacteriales bacterium]